MFNKPIILASQSPRRRELLTQAGIAHTVLTAPADEGSIAYVPHHPEDYVTAEAVLKNDAVLKIAPDDCVILSADTIVYDDVTDTVLGKPKDRDHAYRMLKSLSGRHHRVITGVCITDKASDTRDSFAVSTDVYFRTLTDEEIYTYIDSAQPYDKAGAYGIQESACIFVERIDGDYCNVVGLPVCEVYVRLHDVVKEERRKNK
ncbi:MAG: septum formation protein Maf [Clostridia bacterium]|nr:septum formation protein Maf [Clostridia bacterium]